MSGFAALVEWGGQPARAQVAPVVDALAACGTDRLESAEAGQCALVHAALWTTTEQERERQPQRDVRRDVWVSLDGRLDDRTGLAARLRGSDRPVATDADLLLAAYARWGVDCVHHLVGDFAFAVWDGTRRELLVARDPLGIRPALYTVTNAGVVAASTLSAVLAGLGHVPSIDAEYLAGYLVGVPPRDRSIRAGVHRVPPGHLLRVTRDAVRLHRYWNPSIEPLKQSLEATIEQVRATFDDAVRDRLRSRTSVACELSGGLDSSTVLATAAGMTSDVAAVGLAFRLDREADETHHQRSVADFVDVPLELIEADELPPIDPTRFTARHGEPLYAVDATDTAALYETARRGGRSVVLNGVGGDEAFLGSARGVLDLAARGRWVTALRWASRGGLTTRQTAPIIARLLARSTLADLLSTSATRWPHSTVGRRLERLRRDRARAAAPWLTSPPTPGRQPRPHGVSRAVADRWAQYVTAPWTTAAIELTGTLAADAGVEPRYPFLDVRLVELVLRLPEHQIRVGGWHRGLHRLALGARLPASVRARTDKADLSRPYMRKLHGAVSRPQVEKALHILSGSVDSAAMLRTYEDGIEGLDPAPGRPRGFDLWAAISAGSVVTTSVGRVTDTISMRTTIKEFP